MPIVIFTLICFASAGTAAAPEQGVRSEQGVGSEQRSGPQTEPAGGDLALTLEKAIALALERNRDVQVADRERHKAAAQVSEARSGVFPQLSLYGQYARNIKKPVMFIPPNSAFNDSQSTIVFELGSDNSFVGGLQLSQVLFNRKVGAALDIAKTYRRYAGEAYRATEQEVSLEVKKAFYGVLLAQKLLEANREGLEVVKANLGNVRSLYQHGTVAEFELLRAEVQLANTEPLFISAENNFVLAKEALKNLVGIPQDQEIALQGEFTYEQIPETVMAQAERNALSTNPSITQLAFQETILQKNITIEKSDYFPTLSLFGSYQWQSENNTLHFSDYMWAKTFNVGLQVSYPLFDGFRRGARVRQAKLDREKLHYTRLKIEEGLKIQIQAANLKMTEAKKRILGQEKSIEQAEKAVRIAQTRFKSGVGTHLELLDTQVAMTLARTNFAQAIYDYLIAQAEWQYAIGLIQ